VCSTLVSNYENSKEIAEEIKRYTHLIQLVPEEWKIYLSALTASHIGGFLSYLDIW
jgi:hypothetical protein